MKSFFTLVTLGLLSRSINATPYAKDAVVKRTAVGSGCAWCTPGPWTMDPICTSHGYEYSVVASSMKNPPSSIEFDVTSFCSEFLRPLVTDVSIVDVTSGTTTSTSTVISLIMFTPTKTEPPSTTATPTGTTAQPIGQAPAAPEITPSPQPGAVAAIKKREFTVPDYLDGWYFYGRLDPACSCIITSALPSLRFSTTETSTHYNLTIASFSNVSF